jgi:hypothetical protein
MPYVVFSMAGARVYPKAVGGCRREEIDVELRRLVGFPADMRTWHEYQTNLEVCKSIEREFNQGVTK